MLISEDPLADGPKILHLIVLSQREPPPLTEIFHHVILFTYRQFVLNLTQKNQAERLKTLQKLLGFLPSASIIDPLLGGDSLNSRLGIMINHAANTRAAGDD